MAGKLLDDPKRRAVPLGAEDGKNLLTPYPSDLGKNSFLAPSLSLQVCNTLAYVR